MRAIAREAGVGIATLYRHFPTRESLVDAVYRDQVVRLTTGARELLGRLPPAAAMRRWMDLFGDWIATKNGMLDTLLAMIESGEIAHAQTRTELLAAITDDPRRRPRGGRPPLRRHRRGHRRLASSASSPWPPGPSTKPRPARLLDLLMDGLRPPPGPPS